MKLVSGLVLLSFAVASEAVAGVGVWTATPNPIASSVVVGPDGTVYTDWGGSFSLQVARSTDHGLSWTPFAGPGEVGADFYQTNVLAVDPAGQIYAAFNSSSNANFQAELHVSRDGGATWSKLVQQTGTQYLDLRIDFSSVTTLFLHGGIPGAVAYGVLKRSSDGGAHWMDIDPLPSGPMGVTSVMAIALDPQTTSRLYAATAITQFEPLAPVLLPVLVSNDRGSTWTLTATNVPGFLTTLVVDPFEPARIFGGGLNGMFRSEDSGSTFVSQSVIPTAQIVADPLRSGTLYAATSASGVLKTFDGGTTWTAINTGLTDLGVNALALDAYGGYLYAATNSGVFVYQSLGPGTLLLNAAHPFTVTLSATDPHTGALASGVATQVNDLWGYFSIPAITGNPGNPEVFVKLLDGTAINGEYWFFYGGLTNLDYTLTVTDVATGATKTYTKPAGSECGGSDTAAFAQ